jgi:hypothetical protein
MSVPERNFLKPQLTSDTALIPDAGARMRVTSVVALLWVRVIVQAARDT